MGITSSDYKIGGHFGCVPDFFVNPPPPPPNPKPPLALVFLPFPPMTVSLLVSPPPPPSVQLLCSSSSFNPSLSPLNSLYFPSRPSAKLSSSHCKKLDTPLAGLEQKKHCKKAAQQLATSAAKLLSTTVCHPFGREQPTYLELSPHRHSSSFAATPLINTPLIKLYIMSIYYLSACVLTAAEQ